MIDLFRKPEDMPGGIGLRLTRCRSRARFSVTGPWQSAVDVLGGGPGPIEDALCQEVFNPRGISDRLVVGRSEYLILLVE